MKKTAFALAVLTAFTFMSTPVFAAEEAATDTAAAESAPMDEAAAPDMDQAVATVNGQEITSRLFGKVLEQVPSQPGTVRTTEMKKEVLDKIVDLEMVAQEAVKAGLDKEPDFVIGLDMFKKQQLFAIYLNREVVEKVSVPEEDIRAYYDANKDEFQSGEEVKASHILVDTEEKAAAVKARLDAGESFEELAKAESSCPSSTRGGDLGSFGRGSMVPEFENAAFALSEGEVSGPVKTQFGYHIIKVTGKKPAAVKSFDDVKEEIEQKLLQDKQQQAYDALLAKLRAASKITVNETALEKIN